MKHIEELPKPQMLHILRLLNTFSVTEKVDGSNLVFGFEDDGRFYTSRANKGKEERFYSNTDYEDAPVNNAFKAAHAALSCTVAATPIPGTSYEIEVLCGRQPNAVVYGSNRIVFIDAFPHIPTNKPSVRTNMIFSDDGVTLYKKRVQTTWQFSQVPTINLDPLIFPAEMGKDEIKQFLVDRVLRTIKPAFRDARDVQQHEDFGVEGIVIADESGDAVKLVDRQTFTLINQFNFAIRNEIKSTGPRFNPTNNKDLYREFIATVGYQKQSIYDTMLSEFADLVGVAGIGKYMTITRTMKKHETIEEFLDEWLVFDLDVTKCAFVHIVDSAISRLDIARSAFLSQWKTYCLTLNTGKQIRYTDEIFKRTLSVFAEVFQEFTSIREKIEKSTNLNDLAEAIYAKQLRIAFPNQ
jgi:hypothetical protein